MSANWQTQIAELKETLPNCLRLDRLRIESRLEQLEKNGGLTESVLQRLCSQARQSSLARHHRYERLPTIRYPADLPISSKKDEILDAIRKNQVVILAGETGSGKTTQIPKICLEAGYGLDARIGCTQPRRVAALSVSKRIAEELGVHWGQEVGCKIRFAEQTSPETYIKMMTDGILLAETQADPDLNEYEVIIIDEAHERSLNIDFLLGYLKILLARRPDLKLIVTSATIDTKSFSEAFGNAPIIEVSGRLFPVEVRYAPLGQDDETGDVTYIDAAVSAVEAIDRESSRGDILIFMPGERDIRETRDLLAGRGFYAEDIIPLYGRLSASEQQRIFAPSDRRKMIVSTNVAETSLTIPGIRYVIDSGLARMSRYNPRTRTKRLPIEPISQSSANQRMGRSGRMENGVCIRLYSEQGFAERPKYTQPEIQRANLAEVILRMMAFKLGSIESFPFINPPQPQAIESGYQLLHELGALDSQRNLTDLGRDLARLPVDPTIGRMILQSQREHAVREVLIIAAGLSIQDPRERPMEARDAADLSHKRFSHPESDYLTLLNIWNAYHEQWEKLKTQNQLRKFCKSHFLSYIRMREWCDIHEQLYSALGDLSTVHLNETNAEYAAIHRSILAGLLGHVAMRTKERNLYRASGNRQLLIFPGSGLLDKTDNAKGPAAKRNPSHRANVQPDWIVAGEIVETSRLYARTVAGINPNWIVQLGRHICKSSYSDPIWSSSSGRVLVRERILLNGLEVQNQMVSYDKINPKEATEIFIQSALVEEQLETPFAFMERNRKVREKIEAWQTRLRRHALFDLDRAFFDFYAKRIDNVSSFHDLNRFLKAHVDEGPDFLCATERDIVGDLELNWDEKSFPTNAEIGGSLVGLDYAYSPGEEHDGFTVKLPFDLLHKIQPEALDFIVPGVREEQIGHLIKSLPKSIRVQLMPIPPKVAEIVASWDPAGGLPSLASWIASRYGVRIPPEAWSKEALPDYLKPRIEVTGPKNEALASGRNLPSLRQQFETRTAPADNHAWDKAVQQWERYGLTHWSFGSLPEQIVLESPTGVPMYAFPGLEAEDEAVNLKLFRNQREAREKTGIAVVLLAELELQKEMAWLQKDLRSLDKLKDLYVTLGPAAELTESAEVCMRRHLFEMKETSNILTEANYRQLVDQARSRLPGIVSKLTALLTPILEMRQKILLYPKPYAALRSDLDALMPKGFLSTVPWDRLQHLPRYLKAILIRAERAHLNPAKDQDKWRRVQPFYEAYRRIKTDQESTRKEAKEQLRWMLEEFKVSLFAQELGTAQPISEGKLNNFLAEMN